MTELERTQDRTPIPAGWEYASAPESREITIRTPTSCVRCVTGYAIRP